MKKAVVLLSTLLLVSTPASAGFKGLETMKEEIINTVKEASEVRDKKGSCEALESIEVDECKFAETCSEALRLISIEEKKCLLGDCDEYDELVEEYEDLCRFRLSRLGDYMYSLRTECEEGKKKDETDRIEEELTKE